MPVVASRASGPIGAAGFFFKVANGPRLIALPPSPGQGPASAGSLGARREISIIRSCSVAVPTIATARERCLVDLGPLGREKAGERMSGTTRLTPGVANVSGVHEAPRSGRGTNGEKTIAELKGEFALDVVPTNYGANKN